LAAAFFALRPAYKSSDPRPVVRIGVILPLTGDMAFMGQSIRRGVNFAIEDINTNPDNRFVYRATFEDNQHQPKQTISIANRMISRNRVTAMMTMFSASAYATAPLLSQHRIIGLHGTPVKDVLDGVYNFTIMPPSDDAVRGFADFARSRNAQRTAIVFHLAGTTLEILEDLPASLPGEVRRFDINHGVRDFGMLIRRVKEWNPDLIIISLLPPELNIIAREMHMQQVDTTQIHFSLPNTTDDFSLFEGVYTLNYSQGNDEFIERMGSSNTFFAAYYYDAIRVFAAAVERAASDDASIPSAEKISAEIKRTRTHDGAVGRTDITDMGAFKSSFTIDKIENGQVVPAK
jgi:branched-chain amino acid transport system substrate-binding protein